MRIDMPYGRGVTPVEIEDGRVRAVLRPRTPESRGVSESELVESALHNPIGSPRLRALCAGKRRILVITSDHTRPVPSRITLPPLLREIRAGSPDAEIRILVATGCHRGTTAAELDEKFGPALTERESFFVHDAFDPEQSVFRGTLPSGGALLVNRLVDWAELVCAEGFIEPHFFAGFSGGRKSVLPGICAKETVRYNHNAAFIADANARTGVLEGNPLHRDMLFAARAVGLAFILNVALDADKRIFAAFAGDPEKAHLSGCEEVRRHGTVARAEARIVVTTNGGYPLDQNLYQTVKGMTAAEACVEPGGVIIMLSSCLDGHGGEGFCHFLTDAPSADAVGARIRAIPREATLPDQWQAQILARVLQKCRAVILVSDGVDPALVRRMHMLSAPDFGAALDMADTLLGGHAPVTVIPDGVGVIVT